MPVPSRTGAESSGVHSDPAGQQFIDVTHTTPADTTILIVIGMWNGHAQAMEDALFDGVGMAVIAETTRAGDSTDTAVKVWGLVIPGAKTATARGDWGASPVNDCAALYCINYKDTKTSSVVSATNDIGEDVNNEASNDTTIASGGTVGNKLLFSGSGLGDDMTPASNAESWTEIEDTLDTGGGQGNNQDLSVYICEKDSASGITVTWAATDENAGIIIELVAAGGAMMAKMMQEGHLNG